LEPVVAGAAVLVVVAVGAADEAAVVAGDVKWRMPDAMLMEDKKIPLFEKSELICCFPSFLLFIHSFMF
jgi:hypothetical protein